MNPPTIEEQAGDAAHLWLIARLYDFVPPELLDVCLRDFPELSSQAANYVLRMTSLPPNEWMQRALRSRSTK